jgi:hypothetical protein
MRTAIVIGLCCWLATVVIAEARRRDDLRAKPMPNQVDIHYRFQESVVSLHEPVVLLFDVHNGLSQRITLTLGAQDRQFFQFSLTAPDGQVVQNSLGKEAEVVIFDGHGKALVEPGTHYQQPLRVKPFENVTLGLSVETFEM